MSRFCQITDEQKKKLMNLQNYTNYDYNSAFSGYVGKLEDARNGIKLYISPKHDYCIGSENNVCSIFIENTIPLAMCIECNYVGDVYITPFCDHVFINNEQLNERRRVKNFDIIQFMDLTLTLVLYYEPVNLYSKTEVCLLFNKVYSLTNVR